MKLSEIIEIRDRLKSELVTVEKFLEIARKYGRANDDAEPSTQRTSARLDPKQETLKIIQRNGGYGSIGNTVGRAIDQCTEKFKLRDVEEAAEQLGQPLRKLQVATVLARFLRKGQIEIVKRRKGSRPAIYRKILRETPAQRPN